MGRISATALKAIVSSESIDVPEGHPWIERRAERRTSGETSIASGDAPTTINFPSTEVRMSYGGQHHYATIQCGHIVDDDGKKYSPSEWASKVAGNTSRNAWRDLWFRAPLSRRWVPAQLLRDQAQEEAQRRAKSAINPEDIGF